MELYQKNPTIIINNKMKFGHNKFLYRNNTYFIMYYIVHNTYSTTYKVIIIF